MAMTAIAGCYLASRLRNRTSRRKPADAWPGRLGARLPAERVRTGLGGRAVLLGTPARYANRADERSVSPEGHSPAENDQAIGLHDAVQQRRLSFDHGPPLMGGQAAERRHGVGLVL